VLSAAVFVLDSATHPASLGQTASGIVVRFEYENEYENENENGNRRAGRRSTSEG
jgi:hypothetical protein